MPFRLFYRGPLKANGSKDDKHNLRMALHPQLAKLWTEEPLAHNQGFLTEQSDPKKIDLLYSAGSHTFICLVSERIKTYAELDILFLRPQPPGAIVSSGGDIDNRLKTLFDGLRRPLDSSELPTGSATHTIPSPCHCLLSDDALISRLSVTTDNLLDAKNKDEVILIITTTVKKVGVTYRNISYIE